MKFLLYLFTCYLLALGFLPCADEGYAGQQNQVEVLTTQNHDCHNEENCPPFCTCSCCSTHITAASVTVISTLPLQQPIDTQKIIFDRYSLLPGSPNSVWQPPRLG